jgi:predicted ArsR family transcriptional regulator
VGEDRSQRYTVTQAADILGISPGAVRNRLSRGTLRRVKEGGVVYVLLPADMSQPTERDTTDIPPDMSPSDNDVLTSEVRDRLRYVEGQLEAERQAHAEARRIIAGLVERIPAIEAPEDASRPSGGAEPHPGTEEAQEGAAQRPWWRRMFGG